MALPLGSRATTITCDCEAPSWVMVSGVAAIVIERASSDGPDNGGAVVFLVEQAAAAATVSRSVSVRHALTICPAPCALALSKMATKPCWRRPSGRVGPVGEVDADRPAHRDGVAGLVVPVERDLREGRDKLRTAPIPEREERRF